jgi:hypothetical protein
MWFNDMSFTIEWNLDESDGLVQESLLGDLRFKDREHLFEERSVYLDSWFEALVKAAYFIDANNQEIKVEIQEESHPLTIYLKPNGRVAISFRGRSVDAESLSEFISELLSASGLFLKITKIVKDVDQNASIVSLEYYWGLLHSRQLR